MGFCGTSMEKIKLQVRSQSIGFEESFLISRFLFELSFI